MMQVMQITVLGGKNMKLKDLSKEELELMSYDDLAYLILEDANKKMKINDLFHKVCKILKLSEKEFEERMADFFEILTTDKRFTMLENGFWDLKEKHSEKVVIDEDDDEVFVEETEEEPEPDNDLYEEDEEENDDEDLKDLVVIDEDEEGENL